MSKLVLYFDLGSQPSRALLSLLKAGNIEYEPKKVDMMKGEHKSPEILALNPVGTLPFLTVDGMPMFESAAILRYLAQAYPSLKQYYPDDLMVRQMTDAALDFNGTVMRPMFIAQIRPRFIKMITKAEFLTD